MGFNPDQHPRSDGVPFPNDFAVEDRQPPIRGDQDRVDDRQWTRQRHATLNAWCRRRPGRGGSGPVVAAGDSDNPGAAGAGAGRPVAGAFGVPDDCARGGVTLAVSLVVAAGGRDALTGAVVGWRACCDPRSVRDPDGERISIQAPASIASRTTAAATSRQRSLPLAADPAAAAHASRIAGACVRDRIAGRRSLDGDAVQRVERLDFDVELLDERHRQRSQVRRDRHR